MGKNEQKPAIRFQGFTDAWEQRKLNEVVNVYDGVHQTPDYKDSGVMFLSVENISTLKSEKYISEEAFQRDHKVYPQKGDILMTRIGDVGTPNVVEITEKVAFYVSLALLKPTKINSYFLCNSIQSPLFQKGLKDRTLVTAIPQKINKDEIGKVNIILPTSSQEQQLIGEYFRNLDNLITLHQRKYEKLTNIKKSMLERMFPRDGANVPEIRFSGFTEAWEQRKLGEVIRLKGRIGFRGYTEKDIVSKDDGGVLTFSPTNIVDNKLTTNCKNTYITRFKYDESPEIKIHNGDILFVKTGSTLGKSALVTGLSEDATLNPQVVVMRTNNLNAEFLAAMLVTNTIISQVNSAKIGGAVPTLTETRIKDFDVAIPVSEAEKEQIGQFISQLDNLITLHQHKLEKLKNIKKSMLEKMFV